MTDTLPRLSILHLAASERWTGAAEPLVSLTSQQIAMGHEAYVGCVPGKTFEEETRRRNVPLLEGIQLNRRMNPFHLLNDLRLIPRFCHEKHIDIVHCHLLHDHWTAALALRGFRARRTIPPLLFRTIHASTPPRTDRWHRRLFTEYTDGLACVSQNMATRTEHALDLPEGSVAATTGAVDLQRFRPDLKGTAFREELGIPLDAPVAGIVSRVRAGRGVRWLMRAVPEVLERVPNSHIVIVGRGELKKWFRAEILDPKYEGRVHNGGYRTDDLPQAYAAFDTTLFLGLGSEGTCRAILEAMASGKPTIGADIGAVPETIRNSETGMLVRHRNVEDLAEKLVTMLSDRERCAEMGRTARAIAERAYTERARAEAFERAYLQAYKRHVPQSL